MQLKYSNYVVFSHIHGFAVNILGWFKYSPCPLEWKRQGFCLRTIFIL